VGSESRTEGSIIPNSLNSDINLDTKLLEDRNLLIEKLQDALDINDFNLDLYTVAECQAEIKRCTDLNKSNRQLTALIATNTALFAYFQNVVIYVVSVLMKKQPADYLLFTSFTGIAWSIKPLYGWTSDSIYPFKYRIKPYVTIVQSIYICISLYIAYFTYNYTHDTPLFNFNTYKVASLFLNICVAFIDSLAWGLTVITTKIDVKIQKLKQRREDGNGENLVLEDNSLKSVGFYNVVRGILRSIASMAGGVFAAKIAPGVSYTFMCTYPVIMVLFALFVYKEIPVSYFSS
jgi:hypothetical protein